MPKNPTQAASTEAAVADLLERRAQATASQTTLDRAAIAAHDAQHLPGDAQWLADDLYEKAVRGDRRARRLLSKLALPLTTLGAVIPEPTWPPIWHPSRRHEIGLA